MLFSQLVYWMLDINYGDLYYIGESLFSRTKIGYDMMRWRAYITRLCLVCIIVFCHQLF